jgi:hypothetical protein
MNKKIDPLNNSKSINSWIYKEEKSINVDQNCNKNDENYIKYFQFKNRIQNNKNRIIGLCIYSMICSILLRHQSELYAQSNNAVFVARLSGILLNFNCSIIILFVLRRFWTPFRNKMINKLFLPIDDFIRFHKIVGRIIIILSIVHSVSHAINSYNVYNQLYKAQENKNSFFYINLLVKNNRTNQNFSFVNTASKPEVQVPSLFRFMSGLEVFFSGEHKFMTILSGWFLNLILLTIFIFALSVIRKTGHFQVIPSMTFTLINIL